MLPSALPSDAPPDDSVLSVSQLTALVKETLEAAIPPCWVAGEVSNLRYQSSGHVYFDLKDDRAKLPAVMWKGQASRLKFRLENGQEVLCLGELNVYPPHGKYQLIARRIEPRGEGALQAALRQLRVRLAAEGMFDESRKRPLPKFPRRIAAVTSPTGAALRDFLQVLTRRWPRADVLVAPARVQGDEAAGEIVQALARLNRLPAPPEVIFVGRGGGSIEDLWCFNEEAVVRAVAASRLPVVCGVGHEIDWTLSDLAADLRAPTPSAAAELIAPDQAEVQRALAERQQRMSALLSARLNQARRELDALAQRRPLRRPLERLQELARMLDELEQQAGRALHRRTSAAGERLAAAAARLEALSPLAVLSRGYSVTFQGPGGPALTDAGQVEPGDVITTRLQRGSLVSRVETATSTDDAS